MLLEKGMVIYTTDGRSRLRITRTTAKRAYCKINDRHEIEFNREPRDETWFKYRGASAWGVDGYSVETPTLKEKYQRFAAIRACERILFNRLKTETLQRILNLVECEKIDKTD